MAVFKRNSVICGGGVDISNRIAISRPAPAQEEPVQQTASAPTQAKPDLAAELELRLQLLEEREAEAERKHQELDALKERYIEQGKEVILEAKRRADSIIDEADKNAKEIIADAQAQKDSVFIKARADGFEQGKKDGVEACLAQGHDILDSAKAYAQSINAEKDELFAKYENDIFDTVMMIANKVTLDSLTAKDSTVVKKLIKKAAKEFRNTDRIRITLDKNGATETLAADYEYLKELCGGVQHVEVELLPDAEPGTVIVESGGEITDAGIHTQLRMIQELGEGKFLTPRKRSTRRKSDPKPRDEE
ncbi:MAG: FliH/SctL family protein [Oscillospiraceae bacterium]